MADDPFAGYTPPSQQDQGSDPFASYNPSASSQAPGGQDLGTTALWNKPANVSWGDYMLAHLSKQFQGAGQASQDYARAINDAATFGLADRLQSAMTGNSLEQERALTQAAHQRLGAGDYIANAAGYLPTAELGIAGRLGGGVLGAMGEGALAGGAGAAGHDQSITGGAISGGIGGGVAGALSKAVINPVARAIASKLGMGADVNAAAGDITTTLKANRDQAYEALKDLPFAGSDVSQAAANARADIEAADPGGALQQNAPRTMSELARIEKRLKAGQQTLTGQDASDWLVSQRGTMPQDNYRQAWADLQQTGQITLPGQAAQSAHDIRTSLDNLRDYQGPNAGAENDLAPIVEGHLNDVLANARPTNGAPIGAGATMMQAAQDAHKVYKNAKGLQKAASGLRDFGSSPAGWAQDVAERYYGGDPNSSQYKALSSIANAGGAPGGQSAYSLVHGLVHPAVETAAMAAFHPAVAVPVAAAATFLGAKPALGAALGAGSKAGQLNAIYKGYPALTGSPFTPPGSPDVGQALRTLILGRAASNQRPF